MADALREASKLPSELPGGLIPEAWFVRLIEVLRRTLPAERAEAALAEAGVRTADYVTTHRIPTPVRLLLRGLPARLAIPLLLHAFDRNAWTFAGRGEYGVEGSFPGTIVLRGAPTCRGASIHDHGAYYRAAFERLLHLADRRVRVREASCESRGADRCRFTIEIEA